MIRVLVLDDDEVSTTVVTTMLRDMGHDTRSAARTEDAWNALEQAPPDLVILDTDLGAESGVEFLARVRSDPVFADLAVVVYSGVSRREVIKSYLELGVQGILIKPYAAGRLSGEIERLMRDPWRDKQFESAKTIRARTGQLMINLAPLYIAAANEITAALDDLETLENDVSSPAGLGRLDELKMRALAIGCVPLRRLVEQMHKAATEVDVARLRVLSRRFLSLARLLAIQAGADPAQIVRPEPASAQTGMIGGSVANAAPAADAAAPSAG